MNDKVVIGDATLYCGDCLEIVKSIELSDAAIVTDPPYGLGEKWKGGGGTRRTSWRFDPKEAKKWDGSIVDGLERIVDMFSEAVVWGGNYYRLEPSRCWLLWDKKMNDSWTTGQAEMAWTNLDRPVRVFRFAQCEQINEGEKFHPTQKPLALMKWCLKWIKSPIVFDPFMGSGTTGVASVQMERKFIGIEIDPRYFEIACKRIEAAQKQARMEF